MKAEVAAQFIEGVQTVCLKTNGGFMRSLNLLAVIAMALAFALPACAETPFSDADFAPYRGDGPASLEGEAFVKTENGEVRNCSGEAVFLAPDTPFDIDVITGFFFSTMIVQQKAGKAAPYWRESMCDSQGKFTYSDVPAGSWIVITGVHWGNSGRREGGDLAKKITLRPGKNRIVMTMKDLKDPIFGFSLK